MKNKYCKHTYHRYEDYLWRSKSYTGKDTWFTVEECKKCFKLKFTIIKNCLEDEKWNNSSDNITSKVYEFKPKKGWKSSKPQKIPVR